MRVCGRWTWQKAWKSEPQSKVVIKYSVVDEVGTSIVDFHTEIDADNGS